MALKISNAYKQYKNGELILNNFNMNVEQGEIYGLIGASGCGKTTLLSCVVGMRKLDRGEILTFNRQRGKLGSLCGFMPQELALLNVLTIDEILKYYGMIYGMTALEIENQISFLSTFLELPSVNKSLIQNFSDGQKRRISLAVAMLHNPPLLVLDEPTVGLDPVLRQKIWEHLFEITRVRGTTIIISTHYIEETKHCDKIGFMRNGCLIAEDSPKSLLSKYGMSHLEDLCFELCRQDEQHPILGINDYNNDLQPDVEVELKSYRKLSVTAQNACFKSVPGISKDHLGIVCALIIKFWLRYRRDWRMCMAQLILPILVICTFQNVVGLKPKSMKVGLIINDPHFNARTTPVKYCQLNSSSHECLDNINICNFLHLFRANELTWVPTNSYLDGLNDIKLGRTMALLEFPPEFPSHMQDRILHRNFATNKTILGSTITIVMDESNIISSGFMRTILIEKYFQFVDSIAAACSITGDIAHPPLRINAIHGNPEIGQIISYMQPGLLILLSFMISNGVGIMWVEDRKRGLEERDYVTGVNLWHQIVASFLNQSVLTLAEMGIFFALICGVYGMQIKGSWFLAVSLVFIASTAGLAIGLVLATLMDDILANVLTVLFLTKDQAFSCGLLYPLEMAPWLYRQFTQYLPFTHLIDALRSICTRGWGITHPVVSRGFIAGICWILFSIVICILTERRKHK